MEYKKIYLKCEDEDYEDLLEDRWELGLLAN